VRRVYPDKREEGRRHVKGIGEILRLCKLIILITLITNYNKLYINLYQLTSRSKFWIRANNKCGVLLEHSAENHVTIDFK
jgi:hypothetical protein